jgi:SnoaL-like domain
MKPQELAEAFSSHRFEETYDRLAEDVRWVLVGEATVEGKSAVIDACRASLAAFDELASVEYTRFVSVSSSSLAAVDAVSRYVGQDGSTTSVSSADIYEFDHAGRITAITSYAVELDA